MNVLRFTTIMIGIFVCVVSQSQTLPSVPTPPAADLRYPAFGDIFPSFDLSNPQTESFRSRTPNFLNDPYELPTNNSGQRRSLTSSALSPAQDLLSRFSSVNDRRRLQPQMFADSPSAPFTIVVNDGLIATTDLAIAAGARRLRAATNNRAMPQDRIILTYQVYFDALTADASQFRVLPDSETIDLHQYTFGFEKTFLDGTASIDVRMPFANQLKLDTPNFGAEGGHIGNLNGKLKFLLLSDQTFAFSGGVGLEIPTGSDFAFQGNGLQYRVDNEAFFLQPFLAYEERFGEWFLNGFSSIDVALNGNPFRRDQVARSPDGMLNDQTLMIFSLGGGRWIWGSTVGRLLNGVALLSELHYTTTVQNSDFVGDNTFIQSVAVENLSNRSDHLNLTIGSHFAFGLSSLRVGYVQPLRGGDNRVFDSELNIQFNRVF